VLLDDALDDPSRLRRLHLAGTIFLTVIIVSNLIGALKDYRQRLLNVRVMLSLRRSLFDRMLHLPLPKLYDMKTGGILSRLTGDIDTTTGLLQLAVISPSISVIRRMLGNGWHRYPYVQLRRQMFGNALRDIVLHDEDVIQLTIVLLRPEVEPGGRIDELSRDAHAITRPADAAFQHSADVELAADLAQVRVTALERERGRAARHAQLRQLCQRVDNLLGHAITEVRAALLAAHALERQHGDGAAVREHGGRRRRLQRGRADNAFRRDVERPGQANGEDEAESGQDEDGGHCPGRCAESRQNGVCGVDHGRRCIRVVTRRPTTAQERSQCDYAAVN
jgi:ABC-type multidrug transport system fused ATPase/permease subunit